MNQENNVNETSVEEIISAENTSNEEVLDLIATTEEIHKRYKSAQLRNTLIVIGIIVAVVGGLYFYKWQENSNMQYIDGNELAIARNGISSTGNPWKIDSFITQLTWASLYETDASYTEINPYLAEKLDISSNGLTYTITLKEDLKWSDGTPLTVDDVVWSIETLLLNTGTNAIVTNALNYIVGVDEWKEIGYDNWLNGGTAGIEGLTTNGNIITIQLEQAYSSFGISLTQFIILPKHCFVDYDPTCFVFDTTEWFEEFFAMPICSGMYTVNEINEIGDMFLVLNENYCSELSDIEAINMYTDYQNMNLGYYSTNNLVEMTSYRAMVGFEEYFVDVEFYRYLVFNLMAAFDQPEMVPQLDEDGNEVLDADGEIILVPEVVEYDENREENYPMQDVKLRQAISLAIDRETIWSEVYFKTATYDFATTGNASYSAFLTDYNVAEAKRLLAESDYDLSRPLTMAHYHTDANSIAMLNRIKGYLEEIGFTVIIKQLSGSVAISETREYDFYLKAYSANNTIDWYYEYLSSNLLTNAMGTDEFDDLITALGSSSSVSDYNSILSQIQALDEATMYKIPLVSTKDAVYIDASRVYVPEDMVFGNIRCRSALRLDEWYIKKG